MAIDPVLRFTGGGSGTGVSHYMSVAECPRMARLNQEAKEAGQDSTGGLRAKIGTVFHKLAEIYHYGADTSDFVVLEDDVGEEEAIREGKRIFTHYRKTHGIDYWGTVVDTELHLPGRCLEACDSNSAGKCNCVAGLNKEKLDKFWGLPFTCQIDMVVDVEAKHVAQLSAVTGKDIEPGRYLLDHKTKGRKDANMETLFKHSVQMNAYQMAYQEVHPNIEVKGMLVNVVIGHKKMTFDSYHAFLVDPPSEEMRESIGTFLTNAKLLAATDFPNLASCNKWSGCYHRKTGACTLR